MEILGNLEVKIKRLVELVKALRAENEQLVEHNKALSEKIDVLDHSLSQKSKATQDWDKEKASVKKIVDDLIADIDGLIESGSQQ